MFKVVTTSEEDSKDFQTRSAMVGSGAGKSRKPQRDETHLEVKVSVWYLSQLHS